MKKANSDEPRREYRREDLGRGERGKYLKNYEAGAKLVMLSPDVAKAFPTDEAVNNALRLLMEAARRAAGPDRPSLPPTKPKPRH